jgi:thiamine pyrophosphate-dependent acetolactate synthase large subunit-like protein
MLAAVDTVTAAPSSFLAEVAKEGYAQEEQRDGCELLGVALRSLDRILPVDRRLTVDVGRFMRYAWRNIKVSEPSRYLHVANFDSVGLATATALGAAVYDTTSPAIAVVGDGGFMLGGIGEFNTAVRYGLDVVVAVVNDGAYGAEYRDLKLEDRNPDWCRFDWPNFASVAEALGGTGIRVTSLDDLPRMEAALRARAHPLLIDIVLDPDDV